MKPSVFEIEHGPVLKNRSTELVETILTSLATHGVDSISYQLNQFNEYELTYRDTPHTTKTVNLTVLLQTANLGHLLLPDPLIAKLGEILEAQREAAGAPPAVFKEKAQTFLETPSGIILRRAIYYYTLEDSLNTGRSPFFNDANALFRGLPLNSISSPQKGFDSVIFSLIMVSLVAYACNQLPSMLTAEELKNTEKQQGEPVFRGAAYDETEGRVARARKLSSLSSTSRLKKGGKYHFFIQNPPSLLPNIAHSSSFPKEEEVIIPPGYQIVYEAMKDNEAKAYLLSTPSADNYWPRHALRFCYQQYLSKDYRDKSDQRMIGGIVVARPTHGLAHTGRVVGLIEPIIEYFSLFARDHKFRKFCDQISEDDLILLKLAAVFSVSGRESEVSFGDSVPLNTKYRENSRHYFLEYVQQFPECIRGEKKNNDFERMAEIVRFRGYPTYASELNTATGDEREMRNYLNWILSMAHELDLPRCFNAAMYQNSIEHYTDLVETSERQAAIWQALQDYAIALIEAHGDALYCRFKGEHIDDCYIPYDPIFGEISNSPKKLEEASASVDIPDMKLIIDKKPRVDREVTRYKASTMSALAQLDITIAAHPEDIAARIARIKLLSNTEPYSMQLLEDCNIVLAKDPDNIMVLLARAAYSEGGDLFEDEYDEIADGRALADYKHVLTIEPDNKKALQRIEKILQKAPPSLPTSYD